MKQLAALSLCLMLLSFACIGHAEGGNSSDEKLFKLQLALAEKGDAKSQYFLGEMHEYGLGTPSDLEEAFRWYTKAAEQGNPLAIRKLGHRVGIENSAKNKRSANAAESVAVSEAEKLAAEKEKRRAAVRAMLRERMRHPVGDPFE